MAVATMESIVSNHGHLDLTDVMRQFLAWWEERKYCSIERPFGLGIAVMVALAAHSKILSPEFTASAYVVDTLEIVLYSLLHTASYPESIPCKWLDTLKRRDYLEELTKRFADVEGI